MCTYVPDFSFALIHPTEALLPALCNPCWTEFQESFGFPNPIHACSCNFSIFLPCNFPFIVLLIDFLFMPGLHLELLVYPHRPHAAFVWFPARWDELFLNLEEMNLEYQPTFLDLIASQGLHPMGFFQTYHWISQSLLSCSPELGSCSILSRFCTTISLGAGLPLAFTSLSNLPLFVTMKSSRAPLLISSLFWQRNCNPLRPPNQICPWKSWLKADAFPGLWTNADLVQDMACCSCGIRFSSREKELLKHFFLHLCSINKYFWMQEVNLSLTLESWCPNLLKFAGVIRKANKLMEELCSLICLHSCLALHFN